MSTNIKSWKFNPYQRWQISAELHTDSPLHIGSGETTTHPELTKLDELGCEKAVEINACIKDYAGKPYLPATTLKGKLFAWLHARIPETGQQREDLNALFGTSSDKEDSGIGGRAEFHDATLITPLEKGGKNYPHWNPDSQTYIDASIAINRHTRTVAHRKLFYTELVPPNVGFKVVITGMMTVRQAALIIAALQASPDTKRAAKEPNQAATLGADDTSGKGRMFLYGNVKVSCMNAAKVCEWLNSKNLTMAHSLSKLGKEEIENLKEETKKLKAKFRNVNQRDIVELTIQMDGAFLINNPAVSKENEEKHQPLLDTDNKPLLSGKSLRGALRAQAECIMRTLNVFCCDTEKPCPAIYKKAEVINLCPVCQVFGATGWQSPLHIHPFKYVKSDIEVEGDEVTKQNFVAIDRFHGGGKHTALFNVSFSLRPGFTGFIELDDRMPVWGKGLLALVWRDLHEGDIKLGFGANKGYGGVEKITSDHFFTDDEVSAFREKLSEFKQLEGFEADYQPNPTPDTDTATPINPAPTPANPFYNPYQFIPVKEPKTDTWLNRDDLNTARNQHSHALYRQELYHGRIRCKLTAETQFFIGAGKIDESTHPAIVKNYRFNGELAIPATSLRGMISSLAEAASNSALRVLDNGLLSYRKPINPSTDKDRPLSAIGMVIGEGDHLKLIPLALPTLERINGRYTLPEAFRTLFPDGEATLKVYLNNAYTDADMEKYLAGKNTWSLNKPIYYLKLDSNLAIEDGILGHGNTLRHPTKKNKETNAEEKNTRYVIGQQSINNLSRPIPAPIFNDQISNEQERALYSPGILRILGKEHRIDMPDTKKHELFIPVPLKFAENIEQFIKTAQAFAIAPEAIKRFHDLSDQRTITQKNNRPEHKEAYLPYHLKGTKRLPEHFKPKNDDENYQLRLKQGDLVYFRPDDNDHNIIAEVSFSAHWRGRVEKDQQQAAKVFDFFDPNLLPFNPARTKLSPAELLFGFIEGEDIQGKKPENALAFAGKVKISTGRITSEERLEPEITLKILASPKLPSPSLYFRTKPSANPPARDYIAKHELNPDKHETKGRKHYLHAMRRNTTPETVQKLSRTGGTFDNNARFPWESHPLSDEAKERLRSKQQVKIEPIQANTTFEFDVDFDNLTKYELGLLCYALKPSESYRHKLGMGKPIGLGTVAIDITELALIDRHTRYAEELELTKRQKSYTENVMTIDRYNGGTLNIESLRKEFMKTMNKEISNALELLGDPSKVTAPVHYPQLTNRNLEEETYRWFVANDRQDNQDKQHLTALDANTTQLPILKR